MAQPLFRAPKGTRDIFFPESARRRELVDRFAELAGRWGYGLLESPVFEDIGVFQRVGEATDIVAKEMFDFRDKGDPPQHLALRPELTASVCRAFAEHRPIPPWKVWYEGPQFRYEQPQAGRYRQFSQIGVELVGSNDAHADVEVISLCIRFYETIGLRRLTLLLNSLGDAASRPAYLSALSEYLQDRSNELSAASLATLQRNPLRVLDSRRLQDQPVISAAPLMVDYLVGASAEHFAAVRAGLDALAIDYEISPRLVRGLDYYTRTTFEVAATALPGAQNAVAGGGRYDGLVADLGGPPAPGVGFALGVDRILLACDAEEVLPPPPSPVEVFVVDVVGGSAAVALCDQLRAAGLGVDRAFDQRSLKAQMKLANRSGARLAYIIGSDELQSGTVTVRDLEIGEQHRVALCDAVAAAEAVAERSP